MHHHTYLYLGIRWIFFRACVVVTSASLLANFLPCKDRFAKSPRFYHAYDFFVDYVALFALNLRADLPSMDSEWMGFRRKIRHGIRNWRQGRMNQEYLNKVDTDDTFGSNGSSGRVLLDEHYPEPPQAK